MRLFTLLRRFVLLAYVIFGGMSLFAQMMPNPDSVRGPALRYNIPMTINSNAFSVKFWTHGSYEAQQMDSTGTPINVSNPPQPPYDLVELLVGPSNDARQGNGPDMFTLRKIGDPSNVGPVMYGDSFEVLSLYGGLGEQARSGFYPGGRVWWVTSTCRNNWATLGMFGIAVSTWDHPEAQGINRIFTLQNTQNPSDNGVVYQNDSVYMISSGDDIHNGKRVWVSKGSRWQGNYNEPFVGDDPTQNRDVAQGKLSFKRYVVTIQNSAVAVQAAETVIPDTPALAQLLDGTIIAIKFNKNGKYLMIGADGSASAVGTSNGDPKCQFTVVRLGKWFGLKNVATGNMLEAVSIVDSQRAPNVIPYTVRAVASACDATTMWAHFSLVPTISSSLRRATLFHRSTLGCLNIPGTDNKVWTNVTKNIPADISSTSLVDIEMVTQNPPAGFVPENGLVFALSVGSNNGQVDVWGIDPLASNLLHYNPYSMGTIPWDMVQAMMMQGGMLTQIKPIFSVSISSDGTLVIADGNGVAYLYDWTKKIFAPYNMKDSSNNAIRLDKVVAGNANSIWGLNQLAQVLYQYNPTTTFWEPRTGKGVAMDVGVGVDGTVVSINTVNDVYRYLGSNQWQKLAGTKLNNITVGSAAYIWGVYNSQIWNYVNNTWSVVKGADGNPSTGYKVASINAAGTCFLIDQDDDISYRGSSGVIIPSTLVLPVVNTSPQVTPPAPTTVQVAAAPPDTRAQAVSTGQIEVPVKVTPAAVASNTVSQDQLNTQAQQKADLQKTVAASTQTKKITETAVQTGRVTDRPTAQVKATPVKAETKATTPVTTVTPTVVTPVKTVTPVTTTTPTTPTRAETVRAVTTTPTTTATTTTRAEPARTTPTRTTPTTTSTTTTPARTGR